MKDKKIKQIYITKFKDLDALVCEQKLKGKMNGNICEVNVIEYEDGDKEFVSSKEIEEIKRRGLL